MIWDSNGVVVIWCEIQVIWLSLDLRFKWFWLSIDSEFKWFGCRMIWDSGGFVVIWFEIQVVWDSSDMVVNWFEIQVIWLAIDLRFKRFGCQLIWHSSDLVVNWCEIQMIWMSNGLRCQKWSFEAPKQNFSARLPSKLKSRSFSARLPSKMKLRISKTKFLCETSFKNAMLTTGLTSEFQYVLTILKWMLQKYCAYHEKVEPRHTNSCNCHAKWSLQSNISCNLQTFHGFCVGDFKHRHHRVRNPCACHAKRIVSDPLQIHHACQRFCNPHELLRLLRILQRVEIPAPATRKPFSTSKNVPRPSVFYDFDFQIATTRRRGANFMKLNFQKCSEPAVL